MPETDPKPIELSEKTLNEWRKLSEGEAEFTPIAAWNVKLIDDLRATRQENLRLLDLVRFVRHDLHNDGLITDEEYAALAKEKKDATEMRTMR